MNLTAFQGLMLLFCAKGNKNKKSILKSSPLWIVEFVCGKAAKEHTKSCKHNNKLYIYEIIQLQIDLYLCNPTLHILPKPTRVVFYPYPISLSYLMWDS